MVADNIDYNECGGYRPSFPQRTIYDSLHDANITFAMYSNSTPHSADTNMEGVARYKDRFLGYTAFFKSAADGSLPAFSWIIPGYDPRTNGPNDDHPCHGEIR